MTTIHVSAADELDSGSRANATVSVKLIAGATNAAHKSGGGEVLSSNASAQLDGSGEIDLDLTPNSDLTPEDTYYRVEVRSSVWNIVVPASGGPYDVGDPAIAVAPAGAPGYRLIATPGAWRTVGDDDGLTSFEADWSAPVSGNELQYRAGISGTEIRGIAYGPTATPGSVIFVLPAGFQPAAPRVVLCIGALTFSAPLLATQGLITATGEVAEGPGTTGATSTVLQFASGSWFPLD